MIFTKRRNIVLVLSAGLLLLPVPVNCGSPSYSCMPAPDQSGFINPYFEVEPLSVAIIEPFTAFNIPVYYYAGYDRRRP
jgi:hypothetical protein